MRDPKRIFKTIKFLEKLWNKHPHLKLGQLIMNGFSADSDIYYVEDNEMIKFLKERYYAR